MVRTSAGLHSPGELHCSQTMVISRGSWKGLGEENEHWTHVDLCYGAPSVLCTPLLCSVYYAHNINWKWPWMGYSSGNWGQVFKYEFVNIYIYSFCSFTMDSSKSSPIQCLENHIKLPDTHLFIPCFLLFFIF